MELTKKERTYAPQIHSYLEAFLFLKTPFGLKTPSASLNTEKILSLSKILCVR
jgi:hypothetical protein